mmetsp:Transcript_48741/g.114410  ORF Transcript_48741/g.114410 Transcript_48741/m.114410 type:complete len:253 (-) Transcript_48741:633-1391(-)
MRPGLLLPCRSPRGWRRCKAENLRRDRAREASREFIQDLVGALGTILCKVLLGHEGHDLCAWTQAAVAFAKALDQLLDVPRNVEVHDARGGRDVLVLRALLGAGDNQLLRLTEGRPDLLMFGCHLCIAIASVHALEPRVAVDVGLDRPDVHHTVSEDYDLLLPSRPPQEVFHHGYQLLQFLVPSDHLPGMLDVTTTLLRFNGQRPRNRGGHRDEEKLALQVMEPFARTPEDHRVPLIRLRQTLADDFPEVAV